MIKFTVTKEELRKLLEEHCAVTSAGVLPDTVVLEGEPVEEEIRVKIKKEELKGMVSAKTYEDISDILTFNGYILKSKTYHGCSQPKPSEECKLVKCPECKKAFYSEYPKIGRCPYCEKPVDFILSDFPSKPDKIDKLHVKESSHLTRTLTINALIREHNKGL